MWATHWHWLWTEDACQAVAGKAEERCDRVLDSGRRLQGQMFNPFRKLVTVDTHYYHEGSPGREVDVGWRAGPTIEKIDNRTRRRRRLRTSGFKPGAPRHRLRRPTTFLGQASIREVVWQSVATAKATSRVRRVICTLS